WGVVLDGYQGAVQQMALDTLCGADTILLTCTGDSELAEVMARARAAVKRVGLVVTNETEGRRAADLGADLVVAKGHEAGGRVGEETTFVLVQRVRTGLGVPVGAGGGVVFAGAAAGRVAGLAGVVLDWQLALTAESPLPAGFRHRLAQMDGSETVALRCPGGGYFRLYAQPGFAARDQLQTLADKLLNEETPDPQAWNYTIAALMADATIENRLWAPGQDACFAVPWAAKAPTVGRALGLLREHIDRTVQGCLDAGTLQAESPLARSHGTTFPVLQGPMTRVSDVPAFCLAVSEGGALPFLALALMRQAQVRDLMEQTRTLMGNRPWGV